jgi:hypothetical protein
MHTHDLDGDVVSIDNRCHFRLWNSPEDWMDHLELDDKHHRCMPTKLGPEFLAWNCFHPCPEIDESIVGTYKAAKVRAMECRT